jgi:hypothetical protein
MNTGASPGAKPELTGSYLNNESSDMAAFIAVVQDTSGPGLMKLPTGANERPLGLLLGAVEAGKMGTVVRSGYYWAIAQAAIAIGARLVIQGVTGKLITDPATAGTIRQVVGYAETVAAADGDQFIVRLEISEVTIET